MSGLVKQLKDWIEKNRELLKDSPELLVKIKEKLAKRFDDEDDESYARGGRDDEESYDDSDDVSEMDFDNMDPQNFDEDESDPDVDDEYAGLSIRDQDELENDDADQWLKQNDPKAKATAKPAPVAESEPDLEDSDEDSVSDESTLVTPKAAQKPVTQSNGDSAPGENKSGGRWKPNEKNYKPEHIKQIEELKNQGYTHREAERMARAHAGPNTLDDAYNSSHDIEEPSVAFLNSLKPHAEKFISSWNKRRISTAEAEKNPELYATGKIKEDFANHHKDRESAWNAELSKPENATLGRREKLALRTKFNQEWDQKNPSYKEGFVGLNAKQHNTEAKDRYQQSFHEQLEHLLTANMSGEGAMDSKTVGQHMGGAKTEEGGYESSKVRDPMAAFAQQNPHVVEQAKRTLLNTDKYKKIMNPEQLDRLNRVNGMKSGAAAAPASTTPKKPTGENNG